MFKSFRFAALLLGFAFLSCGEKLTEEQLYTKARDFEANAQYDQARSSYKKFVADFSKSPKMPEAQNKIDLIDKALSFDQEKLLAEVKSYEAREDLEALIILYATFLKRFPDYAQSDDFLQKLAWSYHNRQEFQKAISTYQRLLEEKSQSQHAAQAQFMVGYIYANEIKDLDRARQAYTAFQQKFPQHDLSDDVAFELEHLGKDINDFDFLTRSQEEPATTTTGGNGKSASTGRAAKQ